MSLANVAGGNTCVVKRHGLVLVIPSDLLKTVSTHCNSGCLAVLCVISNVRE